MTRQAGKAGLQSASTSAAMPARTQISTFCAQWRPVAEDAAAVQAALCAGAKSMRLLSVTGFPSAFVLGWQGSWLPADYMGMAEVSLLCPWR